MAKGDKYVRLTNYLEKCGKDIIELSFKQIEEIVGEKLPESSYKYPALWANTETHSIAYGWLNAGYKSKDVDLDKQKVVFVKMHPIEEKRSTDIRYLQVLDYLEKNREVPYSNPEALGLDRFEKARLLEVKKKGQEAVAEIKKMVALCNTKFGLDKCETIQWLDGSNTKTRNYLWAQMKYSSYSARNESISIFVEMAHNPERARYRISLEIKNDKSDKDAMERFHKFLELPLDEKHQLTYVSGSNEYGYPDEIKETQEQVKKKIETGEYKKVQVCRILEKTNNSSDEVFEQGLLEAVAALVPYYEYVLGKNKQANVLSEEDYWPSLSEYDPKIDPVTYEKMLLHDYCKEKLDVLYYMYKMGGIATCKQIAAKYGNTYEYYRNNANNIAKFIAKETECELYKSKEGSVSYWPVLFVGKYTDGRAEGVFQWKLREQLKETMRRLEERGMFEGMSATVTVDHNMILYGPPGTGKTYYTAIYAVAIADNRPFDEVESEAKSNYQKVLLRYNELKKEERIVFTTFHQSYGYEEFIEGIKPIVDDSREEIGYSIEDGIFKAFCKKAELPEIKSSEFEIKEDARIWKVTIQDGSMNEIKKSCFVDGNVRIGFDFAAKESRAFVEDIRKGDIIISLKTREVIDAIGVVESDEAYELSDVECYAVCRDVKWLVTDINENIRTINGNKMLNRPTVCGVPRMNLKDIIEVAKRLNSKLVHTDVKINDKKYVFIIDEINRGNISKIFGELITLVEDTKRKGAAEEIAVSLPYSGEIFSVPNNVYILGTMNTADRSIALMDTALRRRFKFIEMMPKTQVLCDIGANVVINNGQTLDVAKMLEIINKRIEYLYDREHTIGHAFFTKLKDDPTVECLGNIFQKSVVPLLQEYFYEDYEKIQLVLGDNDKDDALKFVKDLPIEEDIFNGYASDIAGLPENKYEIQTSAFSNIQSYKKIHKSL